ncbi:MAG: hypothetical protein AAF533_02180 [Acidobacteriota bacterium]
MTTCPHCREPVHEKAGTCARCFGNLPRAIDRLQWVLVALFVIGLYFNLSMTNAETPPDSLHLEELRLVETTRQGHPHFIVLGYLRNDDDVGVHDVQLDLRIVDAEGRFVDSFGCTTRLFAAVPRGTRVSFRIEGPAVTQETGPLSVQGHVLRAREMS